MNEIHILKEVRFTNLTEKPLGLSLTSDIGNAIGFQLENENLKSFSINAQYPVQLDYFNLVFRKKKYGIYLLILINSYNEVIQ